MWKSIFPISEQLNSFNSKNVSLYSGGKKVARLRLRSDDWGIYHFFVLRNSRVGCESPCNFFSNTNASRIHLLLLSAVTSRASNTVPVFDGDVAATQISSLQLCSASRTLAVWPDSPFPEPYHWFASIFDNGDAITAVQLQKLQNSWCQHFYQLGEAIREPPMPNHNAVCQSKCFWAPKTGGITILLHSQSTLMVLLGAKLK